MMRIVLSDHERQRLEDLVARPTPATVLHRAQALLWLNAGESVPEVAMRLRVSCATIYGWVRRFQSRHTTDVIAHLTASAHHGWLRPLIVLSDQERQALETLVTRPTDGTILRRAQALLWLNAGERLSQVATRLRVSGAAIHDWVRRFQNTPTADVRERLMDKAQARRLRPRLRLSDQERQHLEELLAHSTEATVRRRAQALLWLHSGEEVHEVARRIRVDRGTVNAWIRRFQQSSSADFMRWLTERLPYSRPRPLLVLSNQEHQRLEELVAHHTDAPILRRTQALLWLNAGEEVSKVASRLRVSRYTVYNWVQGYQDSSASDIKVRLTATPRPEQSQAIREVITPLLLAMLDRDPRELGYDATAWTAMLLSQHLWKEHGMTVSRQRIHHLLRRLGQQGHAARNHPVRQRPVKAAVNGAGQRCDGKSV
jgi:transposase